MHRTTTKSWLPLMMGVFVCAGAAARSDVAEEIPAGEGEQPPTERERLQWLLDCLASDEGAARARVAAGDYRRHLVEKGSTPLLDVELLPLRVLARSGGDPALRAHSVVTTLYVDPASMQLWVLQQGGVVNLQRAYGPLPRSGELVSFCRRWEGDPVEEPTSSQLL